MGTAWPWKPTSSAKADLPLGSRSGSRTSHRGSAAVPAPSSAVTSPTAADEGDDRWYQWSTRFGDDFPADQGWSVVSQWHANKDGSPPLAFNAGPANVGVDQWGIVLQTYNAPGDAGPTFTPWYAPVVRGVWTDIKLHVKWSAVTALGSSSSGSTAPHRVRRRAVPGPDPLHGPDADARRWRRLF